MTAASSLTLSNQANKTAGELLSTSERAVESLWHYPLLNVDKSQVTIGNLVFAGIALLLGLLYLNKLKHRLKDFLYKKFADDKDAANAIENLITYIILIIFVTIILQIANVPLSTFAFVGGALAIGVGLGAQNLINNFMSSLIIMIERPVKMGDTIQIEGVHGKVVSIGARCVTIQTNRKTDVLVPNSKLLQENLVNWSLLDNFTRGIIHIRFYKNIFCKIGKEMGGATPGEHDFKKPLEHIHIAHYKPEEVSKKIEGIFSSFKELMEGDPPEVYFTGTDSWYYNYQVVFSYDTKKTNNLSKLKSDINMEISKHFDLENLVIEYSKAGED